jgi:redox-sensing transcriptional repressor
MVHKDISKTSFQRLPLYVEYLKALPEGSSCNISATVIANALKMGEVQVRKDLASICSLGKPKVGYVVSDLIADLESFLGYDNTDDAVIVGAGQLGRALLNYRGFDRYGFNVVAAFDNNSSVIGKTFKGKEVFPITKFGSLCKRFNIKIGIITVPSASAQEVCDLMIKSGILAVWNFAPVRLIVPRHILLHHENMAVSLAVLSNHLRKQLKKRGKRVKEK